MTTEPKNPPSSGKISPEEYRRRLLRERRRTMRIVRNTLIAIALLALGWWAFLIYRGN
ncbi:MAG: hypothetical protein IJG83_10535 [Thermoguttaceae bacterium]|nr:hypothetical protein [Thermoguttaceae bacterium]MBQ3333845.1 hypothetical protein [Thermoguttaceae bacterium]MBQ6621156.1 hypothetical protein [Thermoguttaceae bacterium]